VDLVDANVLLYAVNLDARHHERSRRWLDDSLSGGEPVAFAWLALLAFLRLSTKVDLFPRPLTTEQALDRVERWLGTPAAVVLEPTPDHGRVLRRLLSEVGAAANLVSDAHLAALAIEHRCGIVSFDAAFRRFGGVSCREP
jgi:toxin-antitoxin system PIN domain toxin